MAKYYKVNLYEVTTECNSEPIETWVGQTVVKKGVFYAKDIASGRKFEIVEDITDYNEDEFENLQEDIYSAYDTDTYYKDDMSYTHSDERYCSKPNFFVKEEDFISKNKLSLAEVLEYLFECSEVIDYTEGNCVRRLQDNSIKTKIKNLFHK